jgi:chromosome segregation ATPase
MIRSCRRQLAFHAEKTLKYLETIFADMPNLAGERPAPVPSDRCSVDLDEDLFAPLGGGRSGALPASLPATPAPRGRAVPPAIDLDERPWPTLDVPPKQGPSPLERKVAEQERELALRCTQVADLYNLQERLQAELQVAHDEIERLNATSADIQETATHHAIAAAERKKAVTALYQENAVLRGKLDKAHDEAADLSRQMLTIETMFNDREMVITTALEQADLLKAELSAATDEKAQLSAALDEANRRHQDDTARQAAAIEDLNRKLESLFVDNGIQLKTRDKLAKRCDELTKTSVALESERQEAKSRLATQSEHTRFLETVLRVERETAEARIKELTEKLEHEHAQRAAADDASAVMRREMAALLRHFAARRPQPELREAEAMAPQQDAA